MDLKAPLDPTITDRLVMRHAPDQYTGEVILPWFGEWPPPAVLALVHEHSTGADKVTEPAKVPEGHMAWFERHENYEVTYFELRRASEIEHPAPPDAHWFRGAEYVARP